MVVMMTMMLTTGDDAGHDGFVGILVQFFAGMERSRYARTALAFPSMRPEVIIVIWLLRRLGTTFARVPAFVDLTCAGDDCDDVDNFLRWLWRHSRDFSAWMTILTRAPPIVD